MPKKTSDAFDMTGRPVMVLPAPEDDTMAFGAVCRLSKREPDGTVRTGKGWYFVRRPGRINVNVRPVSDPSVVKHVGRILARAVHPGEKIGEPTRPVWVDESTLHVVQYPGGRGGSMMSADEVDIDID